MNCKDSNSDVFDVSNGSLVYRFCYEGNNLL